MLCPCCLLPVELNLVSVTELRCKVTSDFSEAADERTVDEDDPICSSEQATKIFQRLCQVLNYLNSLQSAGLKCFDLL